MSRDPRFRADQRVKAAELYRSGLSERLVAERLGLSKTTARGYLNDAGVERRDRSEAAKGRWSEVGPGRRQPRRERGGMGIRIWYAIVPHANGRSIRAFSSKKRLDDWLAVTRIREQVETTGSVNVNEDFDGWKNSPRVP